MSRDSFSSQHGQSQSSGSINKMPFLQNLMLHGAHQKAPTRTRHSYAAPTSYRDDHTGNHFPPSHHASLSFHGQTHHGLHHAHRYRDDKSSFRSSDLYFLKNMVSKENTYKMEPEQTFPREKAEKIVKKVLEDNLHDVVYDGKLAGQKARILSDIIRERVKALKVDRFKIISWVMICEKKQNNMRVASRGLWDNELDGYISVTFENSTLYALGNVYTVYQE